MTGTTLQIIMPAIGEEFGKSIHLTAVPTSTGIQLLDVNWGGHPDFAGALSVPGVSLHLYGKTEVRSGRKMGHLTAVADDVEQARSRALAARDIARRRGI